MKRIWGDHSFLRRLRHDARGNTIALVAAALIPLAGMIGGAVDMSRLYLTKTRLQQACDAGVLAGRKVMATDAWTSGTDNGSAEAKATEMFNANFAEGAYGTGAMLRTFNENEGTVTGTASVAVPMTLMRIFGISERNLDVNCTARMEIPNTDVMFVLDVTGSMQGDRIRGLKSAVKCFYEALIKVATPEKCDGGNGSTDPQGTSYTGTAQIRLGFVPYAVNVNVGKLLPNEYLADSWDYQSREANVASVQAWTLGTESAISGWGNWSNAPTNLDNQSSYSRWSDISTSGSANSSINGKSYVKRPSGLNSTTCQALNIIGTGSNRMLDYADSASLKNPSVQSTTNNPPVHPASQQTLSYTQAEDHTVTGYKYVWTSGSCRLQQSADRTYSLNRSGGRATRPIIWTQYDDVIQNWTYKKVSLPVAALKAGGSSWNGSVSLPIGQARGDTVKLSGSNADTTLYIRAMVNVAWDGCLEEQATFQTNNADPINDWDPVPADALDMDVNLIPSTAKPGSFWGPMLKGAVWGRHTISGRNATRVYNPLTTPDDLSQSQFVTYSCPTPARKLAEYKTVGDLVGYIDSLTPGGNTYHDSGMIWGARLLSPTGIFANENKETPKGGAIQRHLIFMTDGNAETAHDYYTGFGLSYWDRRQTSYDPSVTVTNSLVKARLSALCTKVKNMNITLWVISYGGGVDQGNEDRLRACATSGHYYSASNSEALMARFKQIAAEIAELRLIN
ncbi:MAG TPA: TadE/TadG family type IV pilus assembly protein [Sphingobium sp.]|nr:TadE/TadG family type IV pilus assembly protein [Sphingobium sp.]